jgi:glycosyltransferase involved in cell wall biosynthesis
VTSDTRPIVHFAIPGELATPTGGYGYARRLIAGLPDVGWTVEVVGLPGGFPDPSEQALAASRAILDRIPDDAVVLVDGLAFGAMPDLAHALARRLRLVALVHHPLADETGLDEGARGLFERSEAAALGTARAVICTSHTTARRLIEGFGVAPSRLRVAPPGTDRRARARGSGEIPTILCVGSLIERKGHDVLIRALHLVAGLPWTARFVGAEDRDSGWAASLRGLVRGLGLADRIVFAGAIADPRIEFVQADIFALASRYEGYGMVFAEALAHGLPIVGCRAGAVPEVVPEEAGMLVPPDDPEALAAALSLLLTDRDLRRSKADAAWQAGQTLPDWRETARLVAESLAEACR